MRRRSRQDVLDEYLVADCQAGQQAAFGRLVSRWTPRLQRHARHLCGREDAAADVLQEAWLAIARGIRRLDDPGAFAAWALRIVSHKAADWIRREQRHRRVTAAAADALADDAEANGKVPDTPGVARDPVDDMVAALGTLPADLRLILRLHYIEDLGVGDVARVLGIPRGTVKSRLYRARQTLRDTIQRRHR